MPNISNDFQIIHNNFRLPILVISNYSYYFRNNNSLDFQAGLIWWKDFTDACEFWIKPLESSMIYTDYECLFVS